MFAAALSEIVKLVLKVHLEEMVTSTLVRFVLRNAVLLKITWWTRLWNNVQDKLLPSKVSYEREVHDPHTQ